MTLPSTGRAREAPAPRTGTAGNPGPAVPSPAPRPGPVTPPSAAPRGAASPHTDDRLTLAAVVAAGVTAVLAALFGDWGTWSAPLGDGLPGFPLAWGVTAGPPVVLVALAGVFVAWAGAPSFARTWAHTAAGLATATGLLALLRLPVGPDTTWAALAEASHAGLFGVLAGWAPALAALAVTRRRAAGRTGLTPYVWVTALTAMAPLILLAAGTVWSSPDHAAVCTATECISPRAGLLFTGEVTLRLALPAWGAAIATLAAARRAPRFRALRPTWQILLTLAAAALTVLLAPGLLLGAKI
ncbi:hypothetical protein ACGF0K_16400 [Streptomyces sp. NPDC048156]|uniref:hypothetical protein n=1 Tax=Streptomyces sp. NPDC048156 TaxID=3365502 RepID=UPI00371C9D31